ncbi:helix-turn-helix transcriptional regulator [Listeria welshimeri]|nr:helix-turn-helix transcriptional regulator [Listeria welshimeri]MBC2295071.1 helix-turn-helix transcriptional regulator [Listeria welshimeri]
MTIVERIKKLSNSKKITIAELERQLKIPNGTIRRWDKSTPGIDKIQKVADYFNVSVDYLLGRDSDGEFDAFKNDPELQLFMRELADSPEDRIKQLKSIWEVLKEENKK